MEVKIIEYPIAYTGIAVKNTDLAKMEAESKAAKQQIEHLMTEGWKVAERTSHANDALIMMSVTLQKSGELRPLRCRYCNQMLCRVESFTTIEIICRRCKSTNTFP